ncbi:MAG TPA: RDD family protein [Thermoleophilaceae bacterium]|nr:RDD family protein [Thermoleophilaceae bacterium]
MNVGEAAHVTVSASAQAAAAERAHGATTSTAPPPYAGLVTRAIAFAIDAAIVDGAGVVVAVVVGLGLSILDTPDKVTDVLLVVGGVVFVIWTLAYFVAFWSTTGQTPGMRVMRIRVRQSETDEPPRLRWALVRLVALFLAALPLLLGFLPILLNDRRRGLQDFLGRSVVVHAPVGPAAEPEAQVRSSSTS